MSVARERTLHPQDRLLIAEALAYWASGHGSLSQPADTTDPRAHRAIELAAGVLDRAETDESFRAAIDHRWSGPDGSESNSGETASVRGGAADIGHEAEEADA